MSNHLMIKCEKCKIKHRVHGIVRIHQRRLCYWCRLKEPTTIHNHPELQGLSETPVSKKAYAFRGTSTIPRRANKLLKVDDKKNENFLNTSFLAFSKSDKKRKREEK